MVLILYTAKYNYLTGSPVISKLEMRQRSVEIKGLVVSLYLMGKTKQLIKRAVVSPEWVQLWFLIAEGEFDADLWLSINETQRDFLSKCVHQSHINNREFQKMLARQMKHTYDRLMLIEDAIKMGNLNQSIVIEYNDILDKLMNTGQMPAVHASKLKARLRRSFAEVQRSAAP